MRNEKNAILVCIVDCIVGIIENLLRYFNVYAFTQVAIYGKSYCEAAKDTWNLIQSHGVEAIINDNLISGVLVMGAIFSGIICGIVSSFIAGAIIPQYWITCAVLGFFIGFVMTMTAMEVVESGVATIFVCFAMDPLALRRNDEALYNKFQETYSNYLHFV
jgi:tetrahydromethanopterin S-methyltransferase subunit F